MTCRMLCLVTIAIFWFSNLCASETIPIENGVPVTGEMSGSYSKTYEITVVGWGNLEATAVAGGTLNLSLKLYMYTKDEGIYHLIAWDLLEDNPKNVSFFNLWGGYTTYYIEVSWGSGSGEYELTATFPVSEHVDPEPNNFYNEASPLELNTTVNGSLGGPLGVNISDERDWWYVVTPESGSLTINITSDYPLDIDIWLAEPSESSCYTIIRQASSAGQTETLSFPNLVAGLYYIRLNSSYGMGFYELRADYIPCSQPSEPEPNDLIGQAVPLDLEITAYGQLGYFGSGHTDTLDWWVVTVPVNGVLTVTTVSDSTLEINFRVDEIVGSSQTTVFAAEQNGVVETGSRALKPGTYYIRLQAMSGYGGYTINTTLSTPEHTSDYESNDTVGQALAIEVNKTYKGNLGYHGGGTTDTLDWWVVTVPEKGFLTVTTVSDPTLEINFRVDEHVVTYYETVISAEQAGIIETGSRALKAGTYYIRLQAMSGYGGYTIRVDLDTPLQAADQEPNDTAATSYPVCLNEINTGHLGYYGQGAYDRYDYFSFTLPSGADSIYIRCESDSSLTLEISLYHTSNYALANGVTTGNESILYRARFADDNYLLRVYRSSGYGGYSFLISDRGGYSVSVEEDRPFVFKVSDPYPNPFNPSVTIRYELPGKKQVRFTIYDITGRKVAVLEDMEKEAGAHEIVWKGLDDSGNSAASGIYIYHIQAGDQHALGRMTLLR